MTTTVGEMMLGVSVNKHPACAHCERSSCLPAGYAPLCSKHYLAAVEQAKRDAAERFRRHVGALVLRRYLQRRREHHLD